MTSQQAVNLIREALSKGFEKHFEILYYRKDGEWKFTELMFHHIVCMFVCVYAHGYTDLTPP